MKPTLKKNDSVTRRLDAVRDEMRIVDELVEKGASAIAILPHLDAVYAGLAAVERMLARRRLRTLVDQVSAGRGFTETERRDFVRAVTLLQPWESLAR